MNRVQRNEEQLRDIPYQRRQLSDILTNIDTLKQDQFGSVYRRYILHQLANFPIMANETEIAVYREKLYNLESQYDQLTQNLPDQNESVQEVKQQIIAVQKQIIDYAWNFQNVLASRESEQRKLKTELEQKLRSLPDDEYRLMELERNKTIDEDLYRFFYSEMQKFQVTEASQEAGIRILDQAVTPTKAVSPSTKSQVMVGSTIGLLLGLLISIIFDVANRSIQTLKDVERHLSLPVLGTIPTVSFKDIPDYRDDQKALQIDRKLVTHDYSPTPVGEAYRALRTQLLFSRATDQVHSLVITSISPEEGKSFTAGNLAIIFAQQRTNTLLVDADLRRGVLHNTFNIVKEPGLTSYLSNKSTISEIVQPTHIPNLSVLSCGTLIPNPSELLGSMQMRRFLAEAKRKFDIVIFDAPPLDSATDAVVLGTFIEAVAVVIKAGKTDRKRAKERLEIFDTIPANLIGVIINGTEEALLSNSYSYYHF